MDATLSQHEIYMHRCLELAALGAGNVAPNPMVGAVLVYDNKIIGEGYHKKYGEAHAEVNAITDAMQNGFTEKISSSVMYVSLEPCAHFGKTPPCADLIIRHGIPTVVVGCRDPFKEVDGKGIEKLQAAGVTVITDVLAPACKELNKRFFTFHTSHRPYIILKWAQTADKKIAAKGEERLLISNEYANRLVHKWRSEEASIFIGTNTALLDNPSLTTRLWPGQSPVRLVVDTNLRLPASLTIFDNKIRTIIFNKVKHEERGNTFYYQLKEDVSVVSQILDTLYQLNIQSVIVEGGNKLLQSFIEEDYWDEARVITNTSLTIGKGLAAPLLSNAVAVRSDASTGNLIQFFKHSN